MKFEELNEYRRDLKKLTRRFRTLPDDIEVLKKVLKAEPDERPPVSYRIKGLGLKSTIIKVKRIACRSLKNRGANTGLRLIYCYDKTDEEITLIEIYFKGDKETEDRERVMKNFE